MAFIQIMEFETDQIEEGLKLVDEYRAATEGRRTTQRSLVCSDRDRPGHYVNVVFFESYEAAMKNSEMPETGALATKLAGLTKGETRFLNLEVVRDES